MSHETQQHQHGVTVTSNHDDKDDIDVVQNRRDHDGGGGGNGNAADDDTQSTPTPPITLRWSSRHNNNSNPQKPKRLLCSRCHRPTPAACICDSLPDVPIRLHRTRILVLQHPHELKRKNRSVPLLQLVLDATSFQVAVGRKLGPAVPFHQEIILDESQPLLLLYPGPNAMSLEQAMEQLHCCMTQQQQQQQDENESCKVDVEGSNATTASSSNNQIVNVLVLDGTWKYTKEMDRANIYPDRMLRVQWSPNSDDANTNNDNKNDGPPAQPQHVFASIRTPPSPNHLSTAECIAWLICCLEHGDSPPQQQHDGKDDDGNAATASTNIVPTGATSSFNSRLYEQLMKPLDCMVSKWNSHRDNHHHHHGGTPSSSGSRATSETTSSNSATLHEETVQKRGLEVDSTTKNDGSSTMLPPRKEAKRSM